MATLKSLVDETTNIKNELVECHNNLKNNLIEKGVECSDTDKMSNLIDNVASIHGYKITEIDTGIEAIPIQYGTDGTFNKYTSKTESIHCTLDTSEKIVDGYYNITINGYNKSNNYKGTVNIYVNDVIVSSFSFSSQSATSVTNKILLNEGDIISVKSYQVDSNTSFSTTFLGEVILKCFLIKF